MEVGLIPKIPQNSDGILILPPISEPIPIGEQFELISPAYPPELPPVARALFHGFSDLPQTLFMVYMDIPI